MGRNAKIRRARRAVLGDRKRYSRRWPGFRAGAFRYLCSVGAEPAGVSAQDRIAWTRKAESRVG